MARARSIKPGFFTNEELCELPPLVRVLFAGLWTIADRAGRLEDRPKRIKAQILPYDNLNIDKALSQLHDAGFIVRYTVEGNKLISIPAWKKHQNPHVSEAQSTLPAPEEHSKSTVQEQLKNSTKTPSSLTPYTLTPDSLNPEPVSGWSGGGSSGAAKANAPPLANGDFTEPTPDELAVLLVTELLNRPHWEQSDRGLSIRAATQVLAAATNPAAQRDAIAEMHARHKAYLARHPRARKKPLQFWLKDQDFLHPPPDENLESASGY